jgi:hypothetical protein
MGELVMVLHYLTRDGVGESAAASVRAMSSLPPLS